MKKLIYIICSIIIFNHAMAQDTTTSIVVNPFHSIVIKGNTQVHLVQGDSYGISNESENSMDGIEYKINDRGHLELRGESSKKVKVMFVNIDEIFIDGSAKISSDKSIKGESLEIDISGTGRFEGMVDVKQIRVDISGTGKSVLSGTSHSLHVNISGAGAVEANELQTTNASINISGIGKSTVHVKDTLTANISGNGKITFDHAPAVVIKNISGIGKIGSNDESVFVGETQSGDTVKVKIGSNEIIIIDNGGIQITKDKTEKVKPHWTGFELGFNGYLNSDNKSTLPEGYNYLELRTGKSINVNFNIVPFNVNLYNRQIWFITGLGYSINNFRFDQNTKLLSGKDTLTGFIDSIPYKKSKLVNQFVTVPLLLEFNTSTWAHRSFHFATGVIGAYRVSTHTKRKVTVDGDTEKLKNHNSFFMENFRLEATARIGYRNFVLYGSYALTPLFRDNKGPELYTYSIGLRVNGWD